MLSQSTPDCSTLLVLIAVCLISPEQCMNTYVHFQIIEGNIAQHQAYQPRSLRKPAETPGANDKPPFWYLLMPNWSNAIWKIQGWESPSLTSAIWRWGVWSKLFACTPCVVTIHTVSSSRWFVPYQNRRLILVELPSLFTSMKGNKVISTWHRDGCTEVKPLCP